ncbi:CAP domain-containing protein [Psychrobacillus sp. MER TA 171]|uniref:CAP domain-containing protein n=1 Tax=Psychrobacillus sp. MER TA 171 TaxID=2939577 RepID=UPI0020404EAC|nr:CAP domain-containing protein [Psychrobacillus sp. MER TA 171]MCM3357401.1 CAP domain-containing protein [Psychrobacillus sp. MER TA 171]
MNKKILAGMLAGGLLLTATTASAETAGNSKTTSEAKTSIEWKSLKINSQKLSLSETEINKMLQKFNINKELIVANLANTIKTEAAKKNDVAQNTQKVQKETKEVTKPNNQIKEKPVVEKTQTAAKVEVTKPNAAKKEATTAKAPVKKESIVPAAQPKKEVATTSPTTQQATKKTETNSNSNQAQVSSVIQQVVDLTNAERAKGGLSPLQIDSALTKSAQLKSQDMKDNNYFSHTSPTYGSPFDQMKSLGISYKSAAENIAMGQRSAQEVVQGWMNSAGHRANIMNGSYTHIGVGLSDSGYYWTQQFISK